MVLKVQEENLVYAPAGVLDEVAESTLCPNSLGLGRESLAGWEDWIREICEGRAVTILTQFNNTTPDGTTRADSCRMYPAVVYLNVALTKLTFLPDVDYDFFVITILVDNVQVACSAATFSHFRHEFGNALDKTEKERAVLLQYVTECCERRVICFLEASEKARETFVEALTAIRRAVK